MFPAFGSSFTVPCVAHLYFQYSNQLSALCVGKFPVGGFREPGFFYWPQKYGLETKIPFDGERNIRTSGL